MLLNNVKKEIEMLIVEEQVTQKHIAEQMQVTQTYIGRIKNKKNFVSIPLVCMMEALGYDIQLHYIKRKDGDKKKR